MKKTMKRTKWWLPALILLTAFQLISMAQVVFNDDGSLSTECLIFFGAYLAVEWVYFIAMSIARKRADPALEMIAFFLTGIGLVTVAGANKDLVKTQFVADMLGIFCFVALLWLISNVDRAMVMRTPMAVAAIGLLVLTLILARNIKGAFNWLSIGGMSIQPSEFVKVAFVFVGAATLDKLQTTARHKIYYLLRRLCGAAVFDARSRRGADILLYIYSPRVHALGDFRTIVLLCSVGGGDGGGLVVLIRSDFAYGFALRPTAMCSGTICMAGLSADARAHLQRQRRTTRRRHRRRKAKRSPCGDGRLGIRHDMRGVGHYHGHPRHSLHHVYRVSQHPLRERFALGFLCNIPHSGGLPPALPDGTQCFRRHRSAAPYGCHPPVHQPRRFERDMLLGADSVHQGGGQPHLDRLEILSRF